MQQSDIEDSPASNNSYVSNVKDKHWFHSHSSFLSVMPPSADNSFRVSSHPSLLETQLLTLLPKRVTAPRSTTPRSHSSHPAEIRFSVPTRHYKPISTVTSSHGGALPVLRFFCGDTIPAATNLEAEKWHRHGSISWGQPTPIAFGWCSLWGPPGGTATGIFLENASCSSRWPLGVPTTWWMFAAMCAILSSFGWRYWSQKVCSTSHQHASMLGSRDSRCVWEATRIWAWENRCWHGGLHVDCWISQSNVDHP